MSNVKHMYQACVANFADDTPRLIYADALEEADQETLAELVRLQCALSGMDTEDPRRTGLVARQNILLKSDEVQSHLEAIRQQINLPLTRDHIRMHRGLPEEIVWPEGQRISSNNKWNLRTLTDLGIRSIILGQPGVDTIRWEGQEDGSFRYNYQVNPPRELVDGIPYEQQQHVLKGIERFRCVQATTEHFFEDLRALPFTHLKCLTIYGVDRVAWPNNEEANARLDDEIRLMLSATTCPQFKDTFFNFHSYIRRRLPPTTRTLIDRHNAAIPLATRQELANTFRDYVEQETALDSGFRRIEQNYSFGPGTGASGQMP